VKVAILSNSDSIGGAARAAYSIYNALKHQKEINVEFFSFRFERDNVNSFSSQTTAKILDKSFRILNERQKRKYLRDSRHQFSFNGILGKSIIDSINKQDFDVVNIHWMQAKILDINALRQIKPRIVITLHDAWYFTGGCHYFAHCNNYKSACDPCVLAKNKKAISIIAKERKMKEAAYLSKNVKFVAPSEWMRAKIIESGVVDPKEVTLINNPQNVSGDGLVSKNRSGILAGSMSYDEDRRKGFTFLARMMQLGLIDEQITIFGINRLNLVNNFKGVQYLPRITDSSKLSELYKSSRCFLFTSEDENQSNIIAESMLNGCPVVAFDVGGNSELIQHKVNGYLAEPYSIIDLARGLKWVLENKEYRALSQNCIHYAREKTSPKLVSQNYLNVFKSFGGDINVD